MHICFPDSQTNIALAMCTPYDLLFGLLIFTEQFYTSLDVLLNIIKLQGACKLSTLELKNMVNNVICSSLSFQ